MQILEKPVKNIIESLLILSESQKQFERVNIMRKFSDYSRCFSSLGIRCNVR